MGVHCVVFGGSGWGIEEGWSGGGEGGLGLPPPSVGLWVAQQNSGKPCGGCGQAGEGSGAVDGVSLAHGSWPQTSGGAAEDTAEEDGRRDAGGGGVNGVNCHSPTPSEQCRAAKAGG